MAEKSANFSNLHDIVLPAEISWWPLAPGWYVVITAAVLGIAFFAFKRFRQWKADAFRRQALKEVTLANNPGAIGEILRRVALVLAPREDVASLSGSAWLDWLSERSPSAPTEEIRQALTSAIYSPQPSPVDLDSTRDFAAHWIKHQIGPC